MRESAGIMEAQRRIERKPQVYRFVGSEEGEPRRVIERKEDFGKVNLLNYSGNPEGYVNILMQNVAIRTAAICGYRNEFALKEDELATLVIDRILMDELRVSGVANIVNSEQTPA